MKARPRVRELTDPAEFAEASQVAKAAWGFRDLMVPPPPDMITATHAGGMTAGAFEGETLLAFVHAVPRTNLGRPALHSHLLAVRPDAQGRGLSVLLKLFQRERCLARGIGLVTWTYDPFMLRNARLNLIRLRAVAAAYIPNFYGAIGGIYGDLPSDRFEAHWRLEDPAVEQAARGKATEAPPESTALLPVIRSGRLSSIRRTPEARPGRDSDPGRESVLLPFPAGFPGVFRDDPAAGIAARRRFGRAAAALFAKGYEAISVVARDDGPAYLFRRREG